MNQLLSLCFCVFSLRLKFIIWLGMMMRHVLLSLMLLCSLVHQYNCLPTQYEISLVVTFFIANAIVLAGFCMCLSQCQHVGPTTQIISAIWIHLLLATCICSHTCYLWFQKEEPSRLLLSLFTIMSALEQHEFVSLKYRRASSTVTCRFSIHSKSWIVLKKQVALLLQRGRAMLCS